MLNYKITDTNAFPKRIENYTYAGKSTEIQFQSLDGKKVFGERKVAKSYCQIKSCDTIICTSILTEDDIETVVSTYIENEFKVLKEINNENFCSVSIFPTIYARDELDKGFCCCDFVAVKRTITHFTFDEKEMQGMACIASLKK